MVHAGETGRLRRPICRNYYDGIRPRDRTYPPRDWHAGLASSGDRPSGRFDHAVRGRLSGSSPRRRPRFGWARHDLIDLQVQQRVKLGRTRHEHMFSALPSNSDSIPSVLLKRTNRAHLRHVARASKFGCKKNPSRRYRVFFEVRADLAWIVRSMTGGGCCSPAIAHQTPT
jgi:hypothetical protein